MYGLDHAVQPAIRQFYQTVLYERRLVAGLKGLVNRLRVFGSDSYLLGLPAQLFVYEGNGVIAGGQALDFIFPALIGDRVEGALHHVDVHLQPRVLVALYGQHDFFAGEALLDWSGRRRLRLVPFAGVFRCGMNVVRGLIVVLDLHGLASHHAEYVRMIFAAALVEDDRVLGYVEGAAAES